VVAGVETGPEQRLGDGDALALVAEASDDAKQVAYLPLKIPINL
jgi:hypothetical protein